MLFAHSGAAVNKREWMLSLDREMFDLPFAALVVERLKDRPVYAAERHSIELLPGLWALARRTLEQRPTGFLGVGDPIYNAADNRLKKPLVTVDAAVQLPRLAGSGREIRACQRFFEERAVLEGKQASWERLREEIVRHRPGVLHLAAHFFPSPENHRQVVLALGLDELGRARYAGAEQIAALQLEGSLVVMSGCGSGDGATVAGEGRIGLARAWLQAGARSVLATYWPTIDDDGRLLESFYRFSFHKASNGGPTNLYLRPGDALQKAQVEMIRSGSWKAEPKYWASYFVITKS
jgi:CHAT domain-containing protein